jgi:hypothetical protein
VFRLDHCFLQGSDLINYTLNLITQVVPDCQLTWSFEREIKSVKFDYTLNLIIQVYFTDSYLFIYWRTR